MNLRLSDKKPCEACLSKSEEGACVMCEKLHYWEYGETVINAEAQKMWLIVKWLYTREQDASANDLADILTEQGITRPEKIE